MSVRDVIEYGDFERFVAAMSPDVVWQGTEPGQVCHNRDEVQSRFAELLARGHSGRPEVIAEAGDALVVDPHVEPPLEGRENIHHVFTVRDDRIVRMQDYADRDSALRSVGR